MRRAGRDCAFQPGSVSGRPKVQPKNVIGRLNASIVDALADPAVRQRLEGDLNLEISPTDQQTPEGLGAYQRAEIRKWWPIIKAANIKAD